MNHYLVCDNPSCRFVLDIRVDGKRLASPRFILGKCPQCGGKWSANGPLPRHALGAQWMNKLPHCSCCSGKLSAKAA
jgi:hypothetical protein